MNKEEQKERILNTARRYKKKHFLTEAFGNSYFKYCDVEGYVSPDRFLELVNGSKNKVFPMRREITPEMDIGQYFEIVICQAKGEKTNGKTN